jgi:hypothetical protein
VKTGFTSLIEADAVNLVKVSLWVVETAGTFP